MVGRSSTSDVVQKDSDGVGPLKAIVLTREHKAIYPQERARIQKVRTVNTQNIYDPESNYKNTN